MATFTPIQQFANFPNGPDWYTFFEEFDNEYALTSSLPVSASSPWVGSALSSGTYAMSTDEKFGVAVLSGAATTDNSGAQIQVDMEAFSLVAGKMVDFICRAKLSDGTEDELFMGLGITDTTFLDGTGTLAGGLTHTDSIGFYKPDGETNIYGVVRRDSVNAVTGAIPLTGTSYNVFAFRVIMDPVTNGTGTVVFYLNGSEVGRLTSANMPYDSEEILTPTIAFVSGNSTGTKTATVDYVGVRQER